MCVQFLKFGQWLQHLVSLITARFLDLSLRTDAQWRRLACLCKFHDFDFFADHALSFTYVHVTIVTDAQWRRLACL